MGPFEHLRVVDLSPGRVGAQVSQFFADFGAVVTLVEPPGGAPQRDEAAFAFWARGKRSIILDIDDPADQETIRRLVADADIVIETFPPGHLEARGLGSERLRASNPALIYTSITAFGRQGPCVETPVDADLVGAKLGLNHGASRMSALDDPPYVAAPFVAFSASQVALHGTLAALYERDASGVGQWVEVNMAQSFMTLDTWAWFEYIITNRWPDAYQPTDSYDAEGRPASPLTFMLLVALTADGFWLQFAAVAPRLFAAKMKALGLAWMFTDDAWKGLPVLADPEQRMELWVRMLSAAKEKSLAEWREIFSADPDVFAEQFRRGPVALEHPQLLHDEMVLDLEDNERGVVRQPGAIVKAAGTPADVCTSAPTLDQHRLAILSEVAEAPTEHEIGTADAPTGLPLAGVTILELAVLFAAPHGTTMLTDLGARVIKIEPLAGDTIRNILPFPETGGAKVMQGKDSVCIDLSTPQGLALAHEIAKDVDVVIQGYRAGAVQRMQLDYQTIKALNPDVIYVNAPGYGVDGPYGGSPAYAPSIGAASGIPLANVGETVPERPDLSMEEIQDGARRLSAASAMANAQADGFAALGVSTAILFGLTARNAGAGGQELFSSMLNTGGHAMSAHAVTYPGAPGPPSADAALRGLSPLRRIYDAAAGHVMLAADAAGQWERLATALNDDLARDSRFVTPGGRAEHAAALVEALQVIFESRSAADWERHLLPLGIGCVELHAGPIEAKLFDASFGRASGFVVDVVHPTFDEHPRLAPFVRFSRSATQALPGVLAGQSTDVVLAELGKSPTEIADLRSQGIVG